VGSGDGVVVHSTLPDVSYAFGNAEEKRTGGRVWQQVLLCYYDLWQHMIGAAG
jgi:hypothetical protein